ncbi:MAG: DUF805 domain-containing protein [Pseudomonadota bacterium]
MGPLDAVLRCLTRPLTFRGRASRQDFWWFALTILSVMVASVLWVTWFAVDTVMEQGAWQKADLVIASLRERPEYVEMMRSLGIWTLMFVWPTVALISATVRRLHDTGRTGWWAWSIFIPFGIGPAILLVLLSLPSEPHQNEFGGMPRGVGVGPQWDPSRRGATV